MGKPISVAIPHALGKEEARRRIAEGFGRLRQQMTAGLPAIFTMNERWEGDRLHFDGGALGQKLSGRLDVLADSVHIQVDLPEIFAAIAERVAGKLQTETRLLLEKR